jgi:hypothetical protein
MTDANPPPTRALVADIGGTNARFAVADLTTLALSDIEQFPCAEHGTLADAVCAYLKRLKEPPRFGSIAVAGPVTGDEIKITNSTWSFSVEEVKGGRKAGMGHAFSGNASAQRRTAGLPFVACAHRLERRRYLPLSRVESRKPKSWLFCRK